MCANGLRICFLMAPRHRSLTCSQAEMMCLALPSVLSWCRIHHPPSRHVKRPGSLCTPSIPGPPSPAGPSCSRLSWLLPSPLLPAASAPAPPPLDLHPGLLHGLLLSCPSSTQAQNRPDPSSAHEPSVAPRRPHNEHRALRPFGTGQPLHKHWGSAAVGKQSHPYPLLSSSPLGPSCSPGEACRTCATSLSPSPQAQPPTLFFACSLFPAPLPQLRCQSIASSPSSASLQSPSPSLQVFPKLPAFPKLPSCQSCHHSPSIPVAWATALRRMPSPTPSSRPCWGGPRWLRLR